MFFILLHFLRMQIEILTFELWDFFSEELTEARPSRQIFDRTVFEPSFISNPKALGSLWKLTFTVSEEKTLPWRQQHVI